jgi:undecaprenyl-diphosphatase
MIGPVGLTRSQTSLAVGCSLVVILLAVDIMVGGLLTHFDTVVRDRLQASDGEAPRWLDLLSDLGGLGPSAILLGVVAMPYAQLTWRAWPVVLAAGAWMVTGALVLMVKFVVNRPGPAGDVAGYPGFYPSGHVATASVTVGIVVLIVVAARRPAWSPDRQTAWCLAAACLIGGLTGVYAVWDDHHWVSDAVGGLLLPIPVLVVAAALTHRHLRTDAPTGRVM